MAETRGDHAVKANLAVTGNAKINGGLDGPYLEVIDQKTGASAGGAFTQGDWRTRDLTNTVHNDFATSVTLAASAGDGGDVTLPPGVYYCEISTPAFSCDEHVARLADVTDNPAQTGDTVVLGTSEFSANASGSDQTRSLITGRFSVTAQRTLEIQHRCSVTQSTNGFGSAGNFYETNNVFTVLKMWQMRDDS